MMEINSISEKSRGNVDEEERKSVFDLQDVHGGGNKTGWILAMVIKRIIIY